MTGHCKSASLDPVLSGSVNWVSRYQAVRVNAPVEAVRAPGDAGALGGRTGGGSGRLDAERGGRAGQHGADLWGAGVGLSGLLNWPCIS